MIARPLLELSGTVGEAEASGVSARRECQKEVNRASATTSCERCERGSDDVLAGASSDWEGDKKYSGPLLAPQHAHLASGGSIDVPAELGS